ncbi:hypothetical protein SAMN03097699_0129 [Flavobacteriaceae bacterium MAR_2010_188]|nr:hypothetical protein SAMN03097699_0129 [Flavobacteriaceae bacterium MAR_2010_188]
MNNFKIKIFLICTFVSTMMFSQQKLEKLAKTIKVDADAIIDLNLSHVEIQIETWDKNNVEVEAYIESDKLSMEELKQALEQWDLRIVGSGNSISINSNGSNSSWSNSDFSFMNGESLAALRNLELSLADMPEIPNLSFMAEMPEMPNLAFVQNMPKAPKVPELPELPEGMRNINFDYEAYKKDGEKYLDKWSKNYEKKYGKDYKDKMRSWAKEFGKVDWKKFEKEMEAWGEKFGDTYNEENGAKWEAWGEKFGEQFGKDYEEKMEAWGQKFAAQMEANSAKLSAEMAEKHAALAQGNAKLVKTQAQMALSKGQLRNSLENKDSKTIKTIKLKVPKKAKLKMNVRHGELKFTSLIHNLKADISHATLIADYIDGSETSINVSYSPVSITEWKTGELFLNFVNKAEIKNAKNLMLTSNSSNISLGNVGGNSIINGSFGDLWVASIDPSFKNLNIVLENSDAHIKLPTAAYKFQYKGNRSKLSHPKNNDERTSSFSTGEMSSDKTIIVNSKFSNVFMQ